MGQKVSPIGLRVGVSRGWNSRWFAKGRDYAKFLGEDIKIRNFLIEKLKDAQLSHVDIERNKNDKNTEVNVLIYVARPGVVIGQDGANVELLKKELKKICKGSDIKLTVHAIQNPDLDAQLVAYQIAHELENRASFRTVQKRAIQRVRKAGAKGCRTIVSGRLGGADIARGEGYKDGIIPLHTLRSDIDYATAEADTTYGKLGVKVWICKGDVKDQNKDTKKGERE